jgi:hypothetical protein
MEDICSRAKPWGQAAVSLILVLFLMPAGFVPVQASETEPPAGHLEGVIYTADGETPLKDAQMVLEKMEKGKKTGETVGSNITDETGEYKLQNIPVGFYRGKILVKKKHYRIKRLDFFVHVIDGETNFLSFSLKKVKGGLP